MDQTQQTFHDRLARLEKSHAQRHGGAGQQPPATPATAGGGGGGRPPRKGGGMNLLALGVVGVVGFVLTAAILTMLIVPPDRMFVALVQWQTKTEMATPSTANSGNDLTMMVARKIARNQMQDADPEKAAKIEAFLERTENKSLVDIGRDNMRGFILFEASAEGYPEIGEAASARLDRCKTTECLALVEFEFKEELRAAKSAS